MVIAEIISGENHDGAASNCAMVTEGLAARGHQVLLIHRPGAWIADAIGHGGVEKFPSSLKRQPGEIRRVADYLRARRVDVIHTHMSSANSFGMILRLLGFRRVATAHSERFQLHWLFNDRVIAPSQLVADFHHRINLVPRRRFAVIPNFVDTEVFRPPSPAERRAVRDELGLDDGDFALICVGALSARKRQTDLAAAFATLHQRFSHARLLLVGPESDRAFSARIMEIMGPAGPAARLLGYRGDVGRLLWAADAFVTVSSRETGCIALIEAQATGLPVVSTRWGMVDSYLEDGRTGFIVPVGDVAAVVDRLARLIEQPDRSRDMGRHGRRWVASTLSVDVGVDKVEQVLREVSRSNGAG